MRNDRETIRRIHDFIYEKGIKKRQHNRRPAAQPSEADHVTQLEKNITAAASRSTGFSLFRFFPERAGFAECFHHLDHPAEILVHAGQIVLIHPPLKERPGEKLDQVGQCEDTLVSAFREGLPVADVLFRLEEIHPASGITQVLEPFPEGDGHVGYVSGGFVIDDLAVADDHPERFAAVETGKVNRHRLAGK